MEKEKQNLAHTHDLDNGEVSRTISHLKSPHVCRDNGSPSSEESQSLLGSPYKKIPAEDYDMDTLKREYAFPIMLEASAKGQEIYQDLQSDPDVVIQNDGSVKDSSQNQMNVDRFGISNMHETKGDETANSHNGGYEKRLSESNGLYSQKSSEKFGLDDHQEPFAESYAPQFFAALAANFGSFALGSVLSWTSPALPDLRERRTFGEITDSEETWISSIALLGAAASCPIVGFAMEWLGRRKCMLLLTTPFVLGWLLITFSQNIWMLYAGRFLTGFCGGGCSIVVPVYITETASVKIRGMLASGFDMFITVGIFYIFIVGTYVNWQYQAVACGLIPIIFLILMMFAPESPRYLVEQGRHSDANKALCWLRGASSSQSQAVKSEMDELVNSVDESNEKSASWKDIVQDKSILKPTLIALVLMVFQQLSALDAVMFYTVDIFRAAGADIDENLSANIVGGVQVLATITAALFVDHSGRRFLLLLSEIGMVISLTAMGVFFYLKKENNDEVPANLAWLPLASLMVLCIAFSIGMGPLPWLLMGELLPPHVKGLASGLVTITRWILGFVVTMVFKLIMERLGMHGGYWLFAGFCLAGGIFVYFFVPETKGKTLDEIQQFFQPAVPSPRLENEGNINTIMDDGVSIRYPVQQNLQNKNILRL